MPVLAHRERIVSELARAGALILSAPTGSGKSTQVPQFLRGRAKGKILVLEPRRLSARSLAARVAAETKTRLGQEIGYQVRFDSRPGREVIFQTYGVFTQQLLREPSLPGVGAVVLDEFHERTLDADLSLAWLRTLRKTRPDLLLVVMSATLDSGPLASYLPGAARLDVPGRLFPVETRHMPYDRRAGVEQAAFDALKELAREGLTGSVLVFMPGLREIRRTMNLMGSYCREKELGLHALHGSMEPEEQQRLLEPGEPRVIVSTNVAETGVTIPGVTAVIDSGLHRVAAFDAARGINTLYLSKISRANADQRTGRAGRTAPGRCVRLWSRGEESSLAPALQPEMLRLELGSLLLSAASLPEKVEWLAPPPPASSDAARKTLTALGALHEDRITARGRALLRYPASPRLAAVLEEARGLGRLVYERACAMAALFETEGDRAPGAQADLSELAAGELPWEAARAKKQLERIGSEDEAPAETPPTDALQRAWLRAFADRLAAREGEGLYYKLADGRGAGIPAVKNPPSLILALEVRERAGGGQARQVAASLYLPIELSTVQAVFPGECAWTQVSEFDERQNRVVKENRLVFRGLVLERKEAARERGDKKAAAELWADKFASGELRHPGYDDKVEQLVARVALARKHYPDMGFPALDEDDWRLIYGEVCAGKNSLKDIERAPLLPHVSSYLGPSLAAFLDRQLPATRKMPNGKTGRFAYFSERPPELSARLGDFIGMKGTLALCEGRLPVLFDILAPNYRTVQKTHDLSSFWANTYPEVKKELKRRYPKHPWP